MNRSLIQSFQKQAYAKGKRRVQQDRTAKNTQYNNVDSDTKIDSTWDDSAGGSRKWWKKFEDGGANAISKELVKLSNIRKGQKVLDIATGYGEPAIRAAEPVGLSGSVLAIDISPRILELASERAKARGPRNIEFREGDIENIALPQENFDAVLCRWGLMHFRNLDTVLGNIHGSLVPKGVFASVTWGKPSEVPMLSMPISKALEIANDSLAEMSIGIDVPPTVACSN